MDIKSRVAGGRKVLCLFDVDGTLTPPREVCVYIRILFFIHVIVARHHGTL